MNRRLLASVALALLLSTPVARADVVYIESMADRMEPLWTPLFSGGVVLGLATYLLLRAIRPKR